MSSEQTSIFPNQLDAGLAQAELDPSSARDEVLELPDPFHGRDFLAHELLLWIWFRSERDFGTFKLPDGPVELWLDDKLTFLAMEEKRIISAFNGGAPSTTLEARLSVVSGKVIQEARMGMRQGDNEWSFLLRVRGGELQIQGVKVPAVVKEGFEEQVYERVYLLEVVHKVLEGLFARFFEERVSDDWQRVLVPEIRHWLLGDDQ